MGSALPELMPGMKLKVKIAIDERTPSVNM